MLETLCVETQPDEASPWSRDARDGDTIPEFTGDCFDPLVSTRASFHSALLNQRGLAMTNRLCLFVQKILLW